MKHVEKIIELYEIDNEDVEVVIWIEMWSRSKEEN